MKILLNCDEDFTQIYYGFYSNLFANLLKVCNLLLSSKIGLSDALTESPLRDYRRHNSKKRNSNMEFLFVRAEDGTQTRDPQLGRLMLYQLSYFRKFKWAKMDSNHRRRKPADLQSAPFGHSGICPFCITERLYLSIAMQRYDYFFNLQTKSTIFIAVIAHSSPLLPSLPPERSSACSMLLVVIRP